MMVKTGRIIVVSGPSGVGKSSLLRRLLEKYSGKLKFSVSFTSRVKRTGEEDGVDYFFITHEEFQKNIEDGVFLEWAKVHDNYYGTSRRFIEEIINNGVDCILDIDVQGAMSLMNKNISALYIFIAPPSIEVLKERLFGRSTDSKEVILKRVKNAEKELLFKDKYEYIVVNDVFDNALSDLENIIFNTDK
ncbi:MAG: guanylate kinase [Spirochaetes bacterium]|nr:guanylate kinase [Spirochaetota bacterium]